MTTPSSQLLHVKGRLILTPTSADTPGGDGSYGGEILGTYQALRVRKIPRFDPLTEEGYGSEVVDNMHLGFDVEATAVLRTWDADALANAFPNSAAGTGSTRQIFETGSSLVPGQWMTDFSALLMWAPFDVSHPGLLLYNAVPFYRQETELRLSAFEDLAVEEVRWMCLRDASERVYRLAVMTDLQTAFP